MSRFGKVSGRATSSGVVVVFVLCGLLTTLSASAATPKCFGRTATITGTSGPDELRGTSGPDVIVSRGGADLITARGGNDLICAGSGGLDIVFAGAGNDRIAGGRGFDGIFPAGGNDLVYGGASHDLVTYEGSQTAVTVDLGQGTARGQGRDELVGIEGVAGSEAGDSLIGTEGGDELQGYGGDDIIVAGAGDDFLNSGAGDDDVDGGSGHDFVDMAVAHAGPRLGDDTLTDAGASIDLTAGTASGPEGVGNDILSGIEDVGGTLGNDTIVGNDDFNVLVGFEGDDTISLAGPGTADDLGVQDVALPGGGNDSVTGSSGNDAVDYGFISLEEEPTAGATIDLQAGTASGDSIGTDQLTSIENAVGTSRADVLTGTAQSNFLMGLEGSDSIDGAAGDDTLDGDAFLFGLALDLKGTDTLAGGPGTDTCVGGSAGDTNCEIFELAPDRPGLWMRSTTATGSPRSLIYQRYERLR